ncbi:hypothetical protein BaRGS_00013328 [Batillaria attramentaria]|uniref:Ig-like domain-containing protein n=1 Tax=Batillaria attramentaria TaxID=370345 RepID=A0ABD0L717_9CAEN
MRCAAALALCVILKFTPACFQAHKSTCQAEAAWKGDPAEVICTFNEDLAETKTDFGIHRYDLNMTVENFNTENVDVVLDCYWRDSENFTCDVDDGYQWDGNMGSRITLNIPVASWRYVGRYVCQFRSSEPRSLKPCVFVLKVDKNSASDRTSISLVTGLGAGVGAALVAVLCLVIAVSRLFVYFHRRVRNLEKARQKQNEHQDESLTSPQEEVSPDKKTANHDRIYEILHSFEELVLPKRSREKCTTQTDPESAQDLLPVAAEARTEPEKLPHKKKTDPLQAIIRSWEDMRPDKRKMLEKQTANTKL